jgi:aspartate racemase
MTVQRALPGLVGMATEANCVYYRVMNQKAAVLLGGDATLQSLVHTIDFASFVKEIKRDDWSAVEQRLLASIRTLERGGADFIVLTANTAHAVIENLRLQTTIPILDIREPAFRALTSRNVRCAGLLSTSMTSRQGLFQRMANQYGMQIVVPDRNDAARLDAVIFGELVHGHVTECGVRTIVEVADQLCRDGAETIILGCTDITLLADKILPTLRADVLDTAILHAEEAAARAVPVSWDRRAEFGVDAFATHPGSA